MNSPSPLAAEPATPTMRAEAATGLPDIPIIETGPDFALETLAAYPEHAQALFDDATRGLPEPVLKLGDRISRAWLSKWNNEHLPEIDAVAQQLGRAGCYFLSVNYEWGCTTAAKTSPNGEAARLIRVLDWRTPGLGRHIVAAKVAGNLAGDFITMTWPGYTGVLQAMAPGRFAGALNQAPMRKTAGIIALDWAANKRRVWAMPHMTPAHLLRQVFERAEDFAEARRRLMATPLSAPAIFTLAGIGPNETCVIERKETEARLHETTPCAANHWQAYDWAGNNKARARGKESPKRAAIMGTIAADMDGAMAWLKPPILNDRTRLVLLADASQGRLIAQGFAGLKPATGALEMTT